MVRVKVKFSLFPSWRHIEGITSMAPVIHKFDTRWRWILTQRPGRFNAGNTRLGGPQSESGSFFLKKGRNPLPLPVLEPRIVQLVVWSLYRLSCPGFYHPDGTFKPLPNYTHRSFSFDTKQPPCLKKSHWIAYRYSLYISYLYLFNDVCSRSYATALKDGVSEQVIGGGRGKTNLSWPNLVHYPRIGPHKLIKTTKKLSQDNWSPGLDLNSRLTNGCWRQMTSGHCYRLTD